MRKVIIAIVILLLLTSCSTSVPVNIELFANNLNESLGYELFDHDELIISDEKQQQILYWIPDKFDICCSFFCDKKTGTVMRYTISGKSGDEQFEEFYKKFKNVIIKNNRSISVSSYITDDFIIYIFSDIRYNEKDEIPTLKESISEYHENTP